VPSAMRVEHRQSSPADQLLFLSKHLQCRQHEKTLAWAAVAMAPAAVSAFTLWYRRPSSRRWGDHGDGVALHDGLSIRY
jgi:hypothetical protein